MKIEKNRHLLILDALFSNESKITAEKLALISRSSVRTIKSDLVYLKKQLAEEGIADLISFRGKGYQIKPIDKERYDKLSVDVEAMKRIYYNRAIEETDRRLYIIQRILTEEHILIDDVCESLFVSRSSISKDMERITSFLKTYDISVKPIPGKGLVIEGNETDIRNAMVELHCSQYHDHQQLYPYEPFNKLFYKDRQVYEDLRHAMLRIIRDTEITISDLASKRIPTYLCLVKSRIESGKLIAFDRLVREELLNTYDYRIARQICEDETVRRIVELPEEEIINLARLLLISRDIDMRSKGISNVLLPYVEENTILYNKVLKKSKRKLGKSLYNVEFYRFIELDVQSLQLQLYLKHHFDTTRQKKLITYIERDESLLSPVPLEMARIMVSYLQDEFGEDISETIVTAYAAYYELIMKRIVYPYRKMRLLITATEGLVYSQNLKENLIRKYGDYISDAEVYNLYEMRKLDFNNYDAVVHSGNLMYYAYPLKSIGYDEIDYRKDDDRKMKERAQLCAELMTVRAGHPAEDRSDLFAVPFFGIQEAKDDIVEYARSISSCT